MGIKCYYPQDLGFASEVSWELARLQLETPLAMDALQWTRIRGVANPRLMAAGACYEEPHAGPLLAQLLVGGRWGY